MNPFENKVAIVTGGASGIGKSICEYLVRHGAKVIAADLNIDEALSGGCYKAVRTDVSNQEEISLLITNTIEEYGRIDYMFNNAGVAINGEFKDISLEQWKRIVEVNMWGVVYGCHYVYPVMIRQGFGHIINTASLAGLIPGGLTSTYTTSKHAVVGFSLSLRSEAKLYGIKVSVLCPGYLRTPIHKTTLNVSEFMNSERNKKMNEDMKFPTPDECVDQIMREISKNKGIIISPKRQKIYWYLHRAFPEFIPNMFTRIIKHMKD